MQELVSEPMNPQSTSNPNSARIIDCFWHKGLSPAAAVAAALILAGCARTSVQSLSSVTTPMPKPDVIVVHDFSVSSDQVELDHTIGLRLQEMIGSQTDAGERMKVARQIAALVTKDVVADLRKKGHNVVSATETPNPAGRKLAIEGQFFSINQGSQRQRMILGFGMGASEVRTLIQAYEDTGSGPRLVDDFYATVQSSRRPGMGPMAGAGAVAVHTAASAATSSGLT